MGVLWFSVMELVALFHIVEEMQRASHGAMKTMELHNKSIAVKTIVPSEPQIRAYITVGGGYPFKLQSPPLEGRVNLIHLLVTLTGVGVLCNTSRQSLVTSQTRSCINSWKISIRKLHFMSCMYPQQSSTNSLG